MHIKPSTPSAIMYAATWSVSGAAGTTRHFMTHDYKSPHDALDDAKRRQGAKDNLAVVRVLYW